ncbi:Uncharacterised protein [Bordetella pertussis]|nr:Uncharacterised protein [Bordetella pertussis]
MQGRCGHGGLAGAAGGWRMQMRVYCKLPPIAA